MAHTFRLEMDFEFINCRCVDAATKTLAQMRTGFENRPRLTFHETIERTQSAVFELGIPDGRVVFRRHSEVGWSIISVYREGAPIMDAVFKVVEGTDEIGPDWKVADSQVFGGTVYHLLSYGGPSH